MINYKDISSVMEKHYNWISALSISEHEKEKAIAYAKMVHIKLLEKEVENLRADIYGGN